MLPRFFVPGVHATPSVIALPDDEAAHLTRVLRLTAGDDVRVFDGRGREWHAVVDEVSKQHATVRLEDEVTALAEPTVAITLGIAALKGDKMDDVVRDATMLGVIAIRPLITERTELSPTVIARGGRIGRWQRIAVSSAKQCGRAVVPVIHEATRFVEVLPVSTSNAGGASPASPMIMLAEPQAGESAFRLRDVAPSPEVLLLVGPEGGWTAHEVQLARCAGAMVVTLGHQVLRADAAPIVALTAVRVAFQDF